MTIPCRHFSEGIICFTEINFGFVLKNIIGGGYLEGICPDTERTFDSPFDHSITVGNNFMAAFAKNEQKLYGFRQTD